MSKEYEVIGPYVAQVPVDGPTGTILTDFNYGAILPAGVPADRIEHLVDVGLVRERGSAGTPSSGDPQTMPGVPAPTGEQAGAEITAKPGKSGSKADWKAYAVAQGMAEAEAEGMTRDELAERYS